MSASKSWCIAAAEEMWAAIKYHQERWMKADFERPTRMPRLEAIARRRTRAHAESDTDTAKRCQNLIETYGVGLRPLEDER